MRKLKKTALLMVIPFLTFTANGETLEELKSEYKVLIDTQETKRTMIQENYSMQNELKKQLAELDSELSDAHVNMDKIDDGMAAIILKLNEAQQAYNEAGAKKEEQFKKASKRLRYIYESSGNEEHIELLYSSASDYCLYRQYVQDIMEYDANLMAELSETETIIKNSLEEIKESNDAKEVLESFRSEKDLELAAMYESRKQLLKEYQNDAELMKRELNEAIAASSKVNDIIVNMEKNYDFVNTYTGGKLEWPVEGRYYVSSGYVGRVSPVGNGYEFHTGLDIPAPAGYEITAAESGVVTSAGWINGYGNTVIINHGGGVSTLYAHNSSLLVTEGDKIERGDAIALCGSTGYATGSHCHFEVRVNGEHTDPWEYLKRD
ncbi:murein DD-endopeptidase MepM [Clostridiales bacterium]|nr:murein DD-endopeptidase MepM [Clostridiales bacterium]